MRTLTINLKKTAQSRSEVAGYLQLPGDVVLIERGTPRWLIMLCPCGCGEELPVNLDPRSGPAWRIYTNVKWGFSVYPSVWRDTGCESHFIIWRNEILLFGKGDGDSWLRGSSEGVDGLNRLVYDCLSGVGLKSYVDVADSLGEVPWDVLTACRALVRKGVASEGKGKQRGKFGRI